MKYMLDDHILMDFIRNKPSIVAERVAGLRLENWAEGAGLQP